MYKTEYDLYTLQRLKRNTLALGEFLQEYDPTIVSPSLSHMPRPKRASGRADEKLVNWIQLKMNYEEMCKNVINEAARLQGFIENNASPDRAEILKMILMDDMPIADIADHLGKTYHQVRNAYFGELKRLGVERLQKNLRHLQKKY